ncbi:craniofacial development protein 2-like [Coccinella septempunctata]|uniref:craniofacial development protein 2-like n=1 Tax=Coccinella septempunctata TaxID=41139 RepID=UPI001D07208D|nr:craniofacial development protein 2-like [Coccinella septempunctata]
MATTQQEKESEFGEKLCTTQGKFRGRDGNINSSRNQQKRTAKMEKNGKKEIYKIETWNVRGISGKEMELCGEFENSMLDMLVITETKKKGNGKMAIDDRYTLVWSGVHQDERARSGVGFLMKSEVEEKYLNKWEAINERIMVVEMSYGGLLETIIGVYGPNEDDKKEEKDHFWNELTLVLEEARGTIYIAGDFNGRVGKRSNQQTRCIGEHGEDVLNSNGKRLLEFCEIHGFIIGNTFFEHKDIHKYTREVK